MNKLLQLNCCINIQQNNTYGILLVSYAKVNDGNIMVLLLAVSQTLPVRFGHENKIFAKFYYNSRLVLHFGGSGQLDVNP